MALQPASQRAGEGPSGWEAAGWDQGPAGFGSGRLSWLAWGAAAASSRRRTPADLLGTPAGLWNAKHAQAWRDVSVRRGSAGCRNFWPPDPSAEAQGLKGDSGGGASRAFCRLAPGSVSARTGTRPVASQVLPRLCHCATDGGDGLPVCPTFPPQSPGQWVQLLIGTSSKAHWATQSVCVPLCCEASKARLECSRSEGGGRTPGWGLSSPSTRHGAPCAGLTRGVVVGPFRRGQEMESEREAERQGGERHLWGPSGPSPALRLLQLLAKGNRKPSLARDPTHSLAGRRPWAAPAQAPVWATSATAAPCLPAERVRSGGVGGGAEEGW